MPANSVNAADTDFTTDTGLLVRAPRTTLTPSYVENIGFSYDGGSGVFSVTGANGSSLSATNPGYVIIASASAPGVLIRHEITADQSFTDANGTSDIIGNLFNAVTGVAITVDLPFYVYAVTNDSDDAVAFMICRTPHKYQTPASTDIGTPASAIADNQTSFFAFDSITTTSYDNNPCTVIGGIRMQMDASDDWTVQTLTNLDGPGQFFENHIFTHPLGQFGADSGSFNRSNGGTAPAWASQISNYIMKRDGTVTANMRLIGDGGTDGAGAVVAQVMFCLINQNSVRGACLLSFAGGNFRTGLVISSTVVAQKQSAQVAYVDNASLTTLTWSQFSNGDRNWRSHLTYTAL